MIDKINERSQSYYQVERAIQYLERNFRNQPSLDEIAASVHLSKFHFQRLFKRWAGVTPSQFLHYLTIDYAKSLLRTERSVFSSAIDAGLSSAGRLHDLFVNFEAVSPGEYKKFGKEMTISYGYYPSPFGKFLLATTSRGICALRFISEANEIDTLDEVKNEWHNAQFILNIEETESIANAIFSNISNSQKDQIHLFLKGTNFQIQVWQALLRIPEGNLVSYDQVAQAISRPDSSRAVANAIANNPIGYIIPCHRVIRKTGQSHNYRWGSARKKALLGWEAIHL